MNNPVLKASIPYPSSLWFDFCFPTPSPFSPAKQAAVSQLIKALTHCHNSVITEMPTILIGDFNIKLMQDTTDQRTLK